MKTQNLFCYLYKDSVYEKATNNLGLFGNNLFSSVWMADFALFLLSLQLVQRRSTPPTKSTATKFKVFRAWRCSTNQKVSTRRCWSLQVRTRNAISKISAMIPILIAFFLDISHALLKHSRSSGEPCFYFEVVVLSMLSQSASLFKLFSRYLYIESWRSRVVAANFLRGKLSLRRCFSINLDLIRHYFFDSQAVDVILCKLQTNPFFFFGLQK